MQSPDVIAPKDFYALKQEVDALQVAVLAINKPWYRETSNIVAILALLFSFGTTVASIASNHDKSVRENRREARNLIQRLSVFPIEQHEFAQRVKNDAAANELLGAQNVEFAILATQTREMLDRFPGSFTSTEYLAVATALSSMRLSDSLEPLYEQAILRARSPYVYVNSLCRYAEYLYGNGDRENGERQFQRALTTTWQKFPAQPQHHKNYLAYGLYTSWSGAAAFCSDFESAAARLNTARQALLGTPDSPAREVNLQILAAKQERIATMAAAGAGGRAQRPDAQGSDASRGRSLNARQGLHELSR